MHLRYFIFLKYRSAKTTAAQSSKEAEGDSNPNGNIARQPYGGLNCQYFRRASSVDDVSDTICSVTDSGKLCKMFFTFFEPVPLPMSSVSIWYSIILISTRSDSSSRGTMQRHNISPELSTTASPHFADPGSIARTLSPIL